MKSINIFINKKVKECLKMDNVLSDTTDLRELGLTSLNVIEIITALEDEYNFEIQEEDLDVSKLSSIGAYEEVVKKYTNMVDTNISRRDAWNLVGGRFWKQGRESARPNNHDMHSFVSGLEKSANVAIIGASTKYLIEYAINLQHNVTVLDFSDIMLKDLKDEIGKKCEYILYDILQDIPIELFAKFDCVISDRLINRFTKDESIRVICNSLQLLKDTGIVKHAIKLGLYEMDEKLIQYGKEHNILESFYDNATKTFDYTKTKEFLSDCIVAHGNIPKDILFQWYMGRGRESRFDLDDIKKVINDAGGIIDCIGDYESNNKTKIFLIRKNQNK